MAVVVVALKVVGGKAVGHLAVAVGKETAVDGLVEQATHPAEGAAMHLPAVAKVGWALNWPKGFFNKEGRKKQYMRITLASLTATVALVPNID